MRARCGHISTSDLKSDVIILFLDSDFVKDAKISAICIPLRKIYDFFYICMDFYDLLA